MNNPWKKENWNVTEQGRYLTTHGLAAARSAARAAGLDPDTQPVLRLDGGSVPPRPLPASEPRGLDMSAFMARRFTSRPFFGVDFSGDSSSRK